MKKIFLTIAAIALVSAGAAGIAQAQKKEAPKENKPAAASEDTGSLALTMGKPDAPVLIEEYASFSCSHCAHFEKDVLPKVKEKLIDTGKARLEMISYMRNAPDLRATMMLSCLKDNEKRWQFAKVLFSMQEQWAFDEKFQESLGKIAQVGGMSKKDFDACMADKALEEKLIKGRDAIDKKRKIEGTPAFFANGKALVGSPNLELFTKAIP